MKILKAISKNYYSFALILIFIFAFFLRVFYLPEGAISFAYDQARDAFIVKDMLGGDLKIQGPSVSGVPGLYHGVLYYYVIASAYYFGHGNPVIVAYFMSFVSSLGIFVIYYLGFLLTKKKNVGLLSALFFAISFELTQYANLLTNASMGVWFIPIYYLGLYLWITKKSKLAPFITGLCLGLSIQSEIALGYHGLALVIWLFIYRKNILLSDLFKFSFAFLLSISSLIISEFKFGFTGVGGVYYLLSGQDGIAKTKELSDFLITATNQIGKSFSYSLFPLSIIIGGLFGLASIFIALSKKSFWSRFLFVWMFAFLVALPFGGWNMKHLLVGVAPAINIFSAIFLIKYLSKNKFIYWTLITCIVLSNLLMIFKENKYGQTIFPLQKDLTLSNEMKVVDYTYENSKKEKFSISTVTSPLFVNTLWAYMYDWYGRKNYGFIPNFFGNDQVGQLGNVLPKGASNKKHFFIIEPTNGIPDLYIDYAVGDQDSISRLVEKKVFDTIVVEEREIKSK